MGEPPRQPNPDGGFFCILTFLQAGGGQDEVAQNHRRLRCGAAARPGGEVTGVKDGSSALQVIEALVYSARENNSWFPKVNLGKK